MRDLYIWISYEGSSTHMAPTFNKVGAPPTPIWTIIIIKKRDNTPIWVKIFVNDSSSILTMELIALKNHLELKS